MRYLCLGYYDPEAFDALTEEEQEELARRCAPHDEEFDRDPWLLLRLRGLDRIEVLEALGPDARTGDGDSDRAASGGPRLDAPEASPHGPERPEDGAGNSPPGDDGFWGRWDRAEEWVAEGSDAGRAAPDDPAALPRSLGPFPFWRAEEPLIDALEAVYRRTREDALELIEEADGDETG